jgi:Outer membrane protein beta-barrel domain
MNRPIDRIIFCLFFILTMSYTGSAQSPFKAGLTVGYMMSQIDGDHQSGYDRRGLTYGLRGGIAINRKFDIMTEMLYITKGALPDYNSSFDKKKADINLKYAEVPLILNVHFKQNEKGFYRWTIQGGVSYARLLKSTTLITKKNSRDTVATNNLSQENYKKHDFAFLFGLNFNALENLAIGFRQNISLTSLYVNPDKTRLANAALQREKYISFRNYYVTFRIQYDFLAPQYKKRKTKKK